MAGIVLEGVSEVFGGGVVAVDDVSLEIESASLLARVAGSASTASS